MTTVVRIYENALGAGLRPVGTLRAAECITAERGTVTVPIDHFFAKWLINQPFLHRVTATIDSDDPTQRWCGRLDHWLAKKSDGMFRLETKWLDQDCEG